MAAETEVEFIRDRLVAGVLEVRRVSEETARAETEGPDTELRETEGRTILLRELRPTDAVLNGGGNGRHPVATKQLRELETDPDAATAGRDAYALFADTVRTYVAGDRWQGDPLAEGLADEIARLGELMEADPELADPEWEIRQSMDQVKDLLAIMERKVERVALDDPNRAIRFVLKQLDRVESRELADLLGTTSRAIKHARHNGELADANPDRAVLVAQLVYDLRNFMTSGGVVMWFDVPRYQLGNRRPIDLLNDDPIAARDSLRSLARAERGQLAT